MSSQSNSKTGLFLMELIIAILFFSLSSAVCVRLFVGAHQIADDDKDLNQAVLWTQNLAETFYGCSGRIQMIKSMYPSAIFTSEGDEHEGAIVLFFNEDWEEIDNSLSAASYEAILEVKKDTASHAYEDVNEYSTQLTGNALVGKIAIIDVRKSPEVFSQIPEEDDIIIYSVTVDQYVKED